MNSNDDPALQPAAPTRSTGRAWLGLVVIGVVSLIVMLPLVLVAGCFRTAKETRTVRDSLRHSMTSNGDWQTHIELHGGPMTLGFARIAASCIDEIPPEVRTMLQSLRGADVGIYEFRGAGGKVDRGAYIEAATRAMDNQAWERAVTVVDREETVMVFIARDFADGEMLHACVAVLHGRSLVLVSAQIDPEPLMTFVRLHTRRSGLL